MAALAPIAARHALTPLQLAVQWDLAHPAVACAAPTLIQEPGSGRSIEDKRAELAATPREVVLSAEEVAEIRAVGDNTGSMVLKGASHAYDGEPVADRWPLDAELRELATRWGIDPERRPRQALNSAPNVLRVGI